MAAKDGMRPPILLQPTHGEKTTKSTLDFLRKQIHLLDCMGVARVEVNVNTLDFNLHTIRLFRPSLRDP